MTEKSSYDEIRKRMRRDNFVMLLILVLLGIATAIEYVVVVSALMFTLTIMMFIAFAVIAVLRALMIDRMLKNLPEYVPDERTAKIESYARSGSWYVTFLVICILFGSIAFRFIVLSTTTAIGIILLTMVYSWIGYRWYYNRKGDVE